MIYLLLAAVVCLAIAGFKITLMREDLEDTRASLAAYKNLVHEEERRSSDLRVQRDRNGAEIEKLCGQINKLTAKKKPAAKKRSS